MGYGIFNFYGWSVGLHWNLMAAAVWETKNHDYKNFGHNMNQDGRGENTPLLFWDKKLAEKNIHDQVVQDKLGALNAQKKRSPRPYSKGHQLQLQCLAELNGQGKPSKSSKIEDDDESEDLLNLLFERGPDFVLIESAKTGDDEMVKIILENEEVDVNIEDDYGYTALCYAALKGYAEIVDLLAENGANVNARNNGGSALVQAVYFGHLKIAKNLIDYGADVNVNIHGRSLVDYAAKKGYDELVEHLLANGAVPDAKNGVKNVRNQDKTESRFKKWRLKK